MKKNIISDSAKKTQEFGKELAKSLKNGKVVFLSGILGVGKTELVRGVAKGLNIKAKITSPTFNIFRVYDFPAGKFYHFDCYRLTKYSDLQELGWEEIIADKNSIVVLEWPECIEDKDVTKITCKNPIKIKIDFQNDNRIISLINDVFTK